VVSAKEAWEDVLGDRKGRQVLDVRVVVNRVADDEVYIMRPLPPANRDASTEVTNQNSQNIVDLLDVSNSIVAKIMPNEG